MYYHFTFTLYPRALLIAYFAEWSLSRTISHKQCTHLDSYLLIVGQRETARNNKDVENRIAPFSSIYDQHRSCVTAMLADCCKTNHAYLDTREQRNRNIRFRLCCKEI